MYKFMLTQSDGGRNVYINLISSSAGQYLSRRPYVLNLIKEALPALKISGQRLVIERDMGRNIGNTDIVTTNDKDSVYYAQPVKTKVFSRFAKNRFPQPSQTLTFIMEQDDNGDYEVLDAWIGPSKPPSPGDDHETADSRQYWETHALVQDAQLIQSKSITKDCPY